MADVVGRSIRLFLVDGAPRGVVTAEIVNWTGKVLFAPRSKIAYALSRPEAKRTGIYFLIGEDPDQPSKSRVYIGESDDLSNRMKQHSADSSKDFWLEACLVSSKDENLTKAHVRYLESRLVEIAQKAERAIVANSQDPSPKVLPEADVADMEFFLTQIQTVLPVLGFDFLRATPAVRNGLQGSLAAQTPTSAMTASLSLSLSPREHPGLALAVEQDGEIIVLKGSRALTESYSVNTYAGLREQLIDEGRLVKESGSQYLLFAEDVTFKSPSAAAAVILNRNANGRTEWKIRSSSQSLKDYQDAQLH